jgi:uncharacterized membrane protein (UPF0127 family)
VTPGRAALAVPVVLSALLVSACSAAIAPGAAIPGAEAPQAMAPDAADPGSAAPATTVRIDPGLTFAVEVADTPQQRGQGLSGRPQLAAGTGMLFVYDDPGVRRFWMYDMRFPIDLAWIGDGRVVGVETLRPCPSREECPTHESPEPVDQVLEVPAGALTGIEPGAVVGVS